MATKEGYKYVKAWRKRTKEKLVRNAGGKCTICGYDKCSRALVFHHREGEQKEFSIAAAIRSRLDLEAEIKKCDLVCANCHAEIHAGV